MAREMTNIKPSKTYINAARARIAADNISDKARYIIAHNEEGRAYPIFVGDDAMYEQLYRKGFIVIN